MLAAKIKLRAERRAGQLLSGMTENGELAKQGGTGANQHEQKLNGSTSAKTISALGINKNQSADWKALADVEKLPEEKFIQIFETLKEKGGADGDVGAGRMVGGAEGRS